MSISASQSRCFAGEDVEFQVFDAPVPFKGDVCPGVSPRVSFLLGPPGCSPRGQRPRLGPCAFLDLDSWQFKSLSFSGLLDGKGGQTLRLLESDEHRNCSFDQSSGSWLGRGQRTRLLEGLASHSMAGGGKRTPSSPRLITQAHGPPAFSTCLKPTFPQKTRLNPPTSGQSSWTSHIRVAFLF